MNMHLLADEFAMRIRGSVALEVLPWLELSAPSMKTTWPRRIHSELERSLHDATSSLTDAPKQVPLLATSNGRSAGPSAIRGTIITAINLWSVKIIQMAVSSLSAANNSDVMYSTKYRSNERMEEVCFKFIEIPFQRDPISALTGMLELRKYPQIKQQATLRFLNATEAAQDASMSLASVTEYDADYDARLRQRLREFHKAAKQLQAMSSLPSHLQKLANDIRECLAFYKDGSYPLPIEVSTLANGKDLLETALAYDNLSRVLTIPLNWKINGQSKQRKLAEQSWSTFVECGEACRVLAAWLRSLSIIEHSELCEFCYRHRGRKLRCAEHASSKNESMGARLGQAISPIYNKCLLLLVKDKVVIEAMHSGILTNESISKVLYKHINPNLKGDIVLYAARLWAQLECLKPILGEELFNQLLIYSEKLVTDVWLALSDTSANNLSNLRRQKIRQDSVPQIISLNGLLTLWWGKTVPYRWQVFSISSKNMDEFHPTVLNQGRSLDLILRDLLRQRAWITASEQFKTKTTITYEKIIFLKSKGKEWTLRKIADELGCSHQKVSNVLKAGPLATKDRKRTTLRPFVPRI